MDTAEAYFHEQFLRRGFEPDPDNRAFCEIGSTWRLSDKIGAGNFWFYGQKDLYDITIHDFYFHQDTVLDFSWHECLSITQYDSISGEELSPYRRLEAGCVKSFIGGYKPYKVLIHKKIPIRCVGIEIMPAYYEEYLQKQYPGEYTNPLEAFASVGQTMDFPEMARLLREVGEYRGNGISARLFYEGKVAQAVSLVVERGKENARRREAGSKLSGQDIQDLENITLYLNDHCLQDISLDDIVKVSFIGARRLQIIFKEYHGCTITEYIQQRRMSQAESLLAKTDLPIGQIAQAVGYSNASRLAELFRKSTGMLPGEYRKMAQRK
ncbi:MAG: helix-turn-helix transcriptional regulator [Eubacteriales bacterium]|nr:helix-turn-helix transcriptional regulator [Eubacteriales bacterium]